MLKKIRGGRTETLGHATKKAEEEEGWEDWSKYEDCKKYEDWKT